jgi:hypothetical protein
LELGVAQRFSNIEHPWENGRAERSFGTLFAKARAMLKYADLPNGLWGRAIQHSVFLKNRCPSSRLNFMAPLQFRTGEKLDFKKLRVFGCPAQIFVRAKERGNSKLSSRSEKGTFIGMSKLGNGFIFRVQRTNKIVEVDSADVKFNETFSDCRDRQGKIVKGGRVIDPDLVDLPEPAIKNSNEKSRFSSTNYYSEIDSDKEQDETNSNNDESEASEIEIEIDDNDEPEKETTTKVQNGKSTKKVQNGKSTESPKIRTMMESTKRSSTELSKIKSSKGFTSSYERNGTAPEKRIRKLRDKLEPNFEPTYKRKQTTLLSTNNEEDNTNLDSNPNNFEQLMSAQDLKYDVSNLNSDLIKLDLSNEENETLMMVQDNNNCQEMDENIMNNMEAEKNSGELSNSAFTVCQQRIQQLITKTNQFKTWLPLIERFVK